MRLRRGAQEGGESLNVTKLRPRTGRREPSQVGPNSLISCYKLNGAACNSSALIKLAILQRVFFAYAFRPRSTSDGALLNTVEWRLQTGPNWPTGPKSSPGADRHFLTESPSRDVRAKPHTSKLAFRAWPSSPPKISQDLLREIPRGPPLG